MVFADGGAAEAQALVADAVRAELQVLEVVRALQQLGDRHRALLRDVVLVQVERAQVAVRHEAGGERRHALVADGAVHQVQVVQLLVVGERRREVDGAGVADALVVREDEPAQAARLDNLREHPRALRGPARTPRLREGWAHPSTEHGSRMRQRTEHQGEHGARSSMPWTHSRHAARSSCPPASSAACSLWRISSGLTVEILVQSCPSKNSRSTSIASTKSTSAVPPR